MEQGKVSQFKGKSLDDILTQTYNIQSDSAAITEARADCEQQHSPKRK